MLSVVYPAAANWPVRKIALALAAVFLVLGFGPLFSMLATSWCNRWEASRLLACASGIRPGHMSEAETRRALSPFDKYLTHGSERILNHPTMIRDSYWISNYPKWVSQLAPHLPNWVNEHLWFLPYSNFSVSPRFQNGELVLLEVREVQEHRGDIHPYAAIVRVLSTASEEGTPELPEGFTGFQVSPYTEWVEDKNGKQIGSSWISREYVTLDERASPVQQARSFEFRLACLTSLAGCHDARKILAISE